MEQRDRFELFLRLEADLGTEEAQRLMEEIPTGPYPAVLRKRDLAAFEELIDRRFDAVEARFDALETRFDGMEGHVDALESRSPDLGRLVTVEDELLTTWTAGMKSAIKAQTRILLLVNTGAILSTAALVFAAAKLG